MADEVGRDTLGLERIILFSDAVMAISITLMPFVASFLAQYEYLPIGVSVYAAEVALIGYAMEPCGAMPRMGTVWSIRLLIPALFALATESR